MHSVGRQQSAQVGGGVAGARVLTPYSSHVRLPRTPPASMIVARQAGNRREGPQACESARRQLASAHARTEALTDVTLSAAGLLMRYVLAYMALTRHLVSAVSAASFRIRASRAADHESFRM